MSDQPQSESTALQPGGVTLLGLGPGDPALLTRQAWDWLNNAGTVYLRTAQHPTVDGFPGQLEVISFDELYQKGESFEGVYAQIVARVLALARLPEGVTYAVPGHPFVAEATCPEIARRARAEGLAVRVIEGLSFLEPTFTALGIDPYPYMALVDALTLSMAHHPSFPPNTPALVAQIYSSMVAAEVKLTLLANYPDEHPVRLVHAAGTPAELVEDLALYEIDRSPHLGLLSSLYVSPLPEGSSFEAMQAVVARLRAPDGCPWDRKQTHQSLRSDLLSEAYEVLDALDREDLAGLEEELGDLMMNILLQTQIAVESGEFRMTDVLRGIHDKLIRRHPHVFGEVKVAEVGEVLQNWEKIKAEERKDNGESEEKGLLDGVPLILPALSQAHEIQDRARRVGFDWSDISGVIGKVSEELEEVLQADGEEQRFYEVGDLIFAAVNLARWLEVDPEAALRATNVKFRRRFGFIEREARRQKRDIHHLSFEEMDALWEQAKREEE